MGDENGVDCVSDRKTQKEDIGTEKGNKQNRIKKDAPNKTYTRMDRSKERVVVAMWFSLL